MAPRRLGSFLRLSAAYLQAETTLPIPVVVVPLYVVDTVQDEPLTVRVEENPIVETMPSAWQTQVVAPASSMVEQHVCAPLPPLPLLLLLHAPTNPTNSTTHADVIRFIDRDPLSTVRPSISSVRELGQAMPIPPASVGARLIA
jgi:hypothetical protein